MNTLKNKDNKVVYSNRILTVSHSQLVRLLKNYPQKRLNLLHKDLDVAFGLDQNELASFQSYYSEFTFEIEVENFIEVKHVSISILNAY